MNTYPSWWNDTITLYCKYVDPTDRKSVKWYRYVIEGCFYKHTVEKITVGKTTVEGTSTICRMRPSELFKPKNEWMSLSDTDREEYFTLDEGDIIVKAEVPDVIDEYITDQRSSDLIKSYHSWPGCFTIETVSINVGGGRGNEHYHVRGT